MSEELKPFTVIYHDNPDDITPEAFQCQAEDADHAEEQCLNAYPDCVIAWINTGYTDAIAQE